MSEDNPSPDTDLVSIGEAAEILGVSVDTVRRWEKKGKIKAQRSEGGHRLFDPQELIVLKSQKNSSVSEVAALLGVSASKLRSMDRDGLISPIRNDNGEREYTPELVEKARELLNKPAVAVESQSSTTQELVGDTSHHVPIIRSTDSPALNGSTKQEVVDLPEQDHSQYYTEETEHMKLPSGKVPALATTVALLVFMVLGGAAIGLYGSVQSDNQGSIGKLLGFGGGSVDQGDVPAFTIQDSDTSRVLALTSEDVDRFFEVNVPSFFNDSLTVGPLTLTSDVLGPGVHINLSDGRITASNIVNTLQGESGELKLVAGPGVNISGLTISAPGGPAFSNVTAGGSTAAAGASGDTLAISTDGSITVTADDASDTLTFAVSETAYSAGDDLVLTGTTFSVNPDLATVQTITLDGTGKISGLDDIDDTTESTLEEKLDLGGDLEGTIKSADIKDGKILEQHLSATNSATDEHCLTSEGSGFEWQACGATLSGITLSGDSGTDQTVEDGDTLEIAGGDAITTATSATDTITIDIDILASADGAGGTSSNAGLELSGGSTGELALLQGCSDNQILKWDEATSIWECSADSAGAGSYTWSLSDSSTTHTVDDTETVTFVDDTSINSVVGGTAGAPTVTISVIDDSIDGTELADAITLDSSTLVFDDGTNTLATLTDAGTTGNLDITGALTLGTALAVAEGGTGATSLTDGGVLLGSGTGAITPMGVLADGTIIIGDGTTDPTTLAAFTSSTGTLTHEVGGLEADVSAYSGLVAISSGSTSEVDAKSELEAQIADVSDFAEADGDVFTGVHDFSGATSLEIPNSDTPTVDSNGEIAFDNSVADFPGVLRVFGGGEEQGVVSLPIGDFTTPTDGHVVTYDETTNEFELAAASSGFSSFTVAGDSGSETITDGNTLTLTGGTGVTTAVTATDTATLSFDCSEVEGTDIDCSGESITLESTVDSIATLNLSGTGTINALDAVDSTTEDTIEALIFDADAENISGVWEVQDDVNFAFGNDADWTINYDEDVDNQLLFTTTNTSATATTDPMFEILVGTTPTANQQVFGVAKGTQSSNTALFTVDEDGDVAVAGSTTFNSVAYTWPGADGTDNFVLTTNGSGTLTWESVTGGPGAGDVTGVGDCTSGDCLDGTSDGGTTFDLYDVDGAGTFAIADLSAARTWTFPNETGTVCLTSGNCAGVGGTGDVVGPGSSTDNAIARFDGTGGKTLQNSGVTIDDSDNLTVAGDLTITGGDITLGTTSIFSGGDTASLNNIDAVDSTTEDTIEALIFDADAENISGVWEVQDDVNFAFGNDADWTINYDEDVDNQLLFTTTNTSATATTDPMFEILVGTTPTANQQVFGVAKGTQSSNTALFTVDEDGDVDVTGALTLGTALTVAEGGTGATSLTDGGLLLGSGTGAITALGVATNGQIPIGDGTTDPVLATITGDDGITITNGAGSIEVDVTVVTSGSDGDSSTTQSDSGFEIVGNELTLLRGCSDNQILKWDETADDWNCEADDGGVSDTFTTIEVDGSAVSTNAPTLDFDGTHFGLTESPTDDFDITIDLNGDLVAGSGLTGGADDILVGADGDTTVTVGAGTGITVNADDVAVNEAYDFTFTGNVAFTPAGTDALDINLDADSLLTIDQAFSSTTSADSTTLTITNASSSGTQRGLVIDNADSTGVTEALLVLDNSDANQAVTTAISLVEGNASGGFTNILQLTEADSHTGTVQFATLSANRTYTLPDEGGTVCLTSGNCAGVGGTGDVVGPGSSTDNAIARFDGTGGKTLQNSGVTIDDSDNLTVAGDLTITGGDITLGTTSIFSGGDTASLNNIDAVDSTTEDTIEALIFDADAENISGVWEVQDDVNFAFGNDADWTINYDEDVDNQLLFTTTNTSATATTDPMFEILVGTTPTANQQVFGVAKGTQSSNTALFTVDEDGDVDVTGALTLGTALTVAEGGTGATSLTDGGLLLGSGTGAITALGVATNGQIPIGDGTTDPVLATITGDDGITITNGAGSIEVDVTVVTSGSDGDSSTTQSDSGFEIVGNELTLLRGCSDNQILKWDETADDWNCEADDGGVSDTFTTIEVDGSAVSTNAPTLDFDGTHFTLTESPTDDFDIVVADDGLDFAQLEDALDLDAATTLTLGANNFDINLDSTGEFAIQDGGSDVFHVADDTGVITISDDLDFSGSGAENVGITSSSTTADVLTITGSVSATNDSVDGLVVAHTLTDSTTSAGINVTVTNADDATAADTFYGILLTIDDNSTAADDTAYGLYIDNPDSGGSDADLATDAFIYLDNSDDAVAVTDGIFFLSAGGAITDAIDASDANITNALNIGANVITGTTGTIDFTNFDVSSVGGITAQEATATHIFGGAASLEIPNSATPTVDANGEIAFDNTVTDFTTGVLRVYGSDEEQGVVTLPIADFTSPTDGHVIKYNATDDEFELAAASGGMTSFTLTADSGSNQTISDGETVDIAGGTNGIDTVVGATDTVTLNLDTTEIGTTTFGSGSGITWTFDASGGTDPALTFGNGVVELDTALNIGGVSGLAYNAISDSGTTSHSLASDDDLFIEGDLEVNGTTFTDGALTAAGAITATSTVDFSGATSVSLPTDGTVDADGEITVDTTDGQLKYYENSNTHVLDPRKKFSTTLESPSASDNFNLLKFPYAITITEINCIIDPGDSSENVDIYIEERDATGDNATNTTSSVLSCDNDGASTSTFSNAAIDANDWVSLEINAIGAGDTVTQVTVTVEYTIDPT